ncbi:MAG: universal stress protein [Actinobacteria bacterium]|nr:universal stress protein [Actinomycetota bacterium]
MPPEGNLPDPSTLKLRRLLLASEGRPLTKSAIDLAARIAKPQRASVHVFSIARVWGTGLGLPMPALLPTKAEWDEQREIVERAVKALRKHGIDASGQVLATRKATKRILNEAQRTRCEAIVMAADPPRPRLLADLMWSQEPYRVRRRSKLPVYLVDRAKNERG